MTPYERDLDQTEGFAGRRDRLVHLELVGRLGGTSLHRRVRPRPHLTIPASEFQGRRERLLRHAADNGLSGVVLFRRHRDPHRLPARHREPHTAGRLSPEARLRGSERTARCPSRSSKPVRRRNPSLGGFDSLVAPFLQIAAQRPKTVTQRRHSLSAEIRLRWVPTGAQLARSALGDATKDCRRFGASKIGTMERRVVVRHQGANYSWLGFRSRCVSLVDLYHRSR